MGSVTVTLKGQSTSLNYEVTAPPVTRKVAYGWNTGGWWRTGGQSPTSAYNDAKSAFGLPAVLRCWPNSFNTNWSQLVPSFLGADKPGLFINLGSDIGGINAGNYDSAFASICANAPTDRMIWLSAGHEPENDGFSMAQWKLAQARLAAIKTASGRTNVRFVSLLMGSTFIPSRFANSAPGNRPASEWFDFDLTNVDALGTDIYQWGKTDATGDAASLVIQPCIDLARAKGKGLVVGEFGSRCLLSDGARATFLSDSVALFNANADVVEAVMYFENDNGALAPWNLLPKPGTNPPAPSLPLSIAVWRSAVLSS